MGTWLKTGGRTKLASIPKSTWRVPRWKTGPTHKGERERGEREVVIKKEMGDKGDEVNNLKQFIIPKGLERKWKEKRLLGKRWGVGTRMGEVRPLNILLPTKRQVEGRRYRKLSELLERMQ